MRKTFKFKLNRKILEPDFSFPWKLALLINLARQADFNFGEGNWYVEHFGVEEPNEMEVIFSMEVEGQKKDYEKP